MPQLTSYPSPIYAILFAISFACWLLFEMWVFSRDHGRARRGARGARGTGLSVILALAIGITVSFNLPAIAPMFDIRGGFVVFFVLGIVLMWAGMLFRLWSIQTLGSFFSTRLMIQDQHELITTGPYKYLRNPSYTAALVTFIGLGFGLGNWLSLGVMLLAGLITYVWRIRVEERMLVEAFGQTYQDYKKRSWALIPFVW